MENLVFDNVELIFNDENKIIDVKNKGKSVKKGFLRGLKKAQETNYWFLFREDQITTNYFSGVQKQLNGFEYSILNWCLSWYEKYSRGIVNPPIQTYDDMKYLLLEINSQAYYDFID